MKNLVTLIIIIIIILLNFANANAIQENSNEVTINNLYKTIEKIVNPPQNLPNITYEQSHIVIKNAIEIIKKAPNSPEAYNALTFLDIDFNLNKDSIDIYKELRDKHFNNLNDCNNDLAEKLVFIRICLLFNTNVINTFPNEDFENDKKICFGALEKFKNDCKDKNYAALATIILFLFDRKNEKGYDLHFKNTFSEHKALPYVELEVIANLAATNDYSKCITETQKLISKFGEVPTPVGYAFKAECYDLMITCYVELNDYNNAKRFLELYESEVSKVSSEILNSSYTNELRKKVKDIHN